MAKTFFRHPIVRMVTWALLALFFVQFMDRWPTVESWAFLMNQGSPYAFLALAGFFGLATLLRTVRWRALLHSHLEVGFKEMLVVFGWSFFLMTITPLRAGELIRPMWMKNKGGDFFSGVGILIHERLADMAVLVCLLVYVMSLQLGDMAQWMSFLGPIQASLIIVGYFSIVVLSPLLKRKLDARPRSGRICEAVGRLLDGLSQSANLTHALKVLMLTGLVWGTLALGYYMVLQSLFPDIHWSASLLVLVSVNLAGLFWLSPGNIGLYEAAAVVALGVYDVPTDTALMAAVALHGIVLLSTLVIGLVSRGAYLQQGGKWTDLI